MARSLLCRANGISGKLALTLLAVSMPCSRKEKMLKTFVITAVENRFGRINTLHKPIEWLGLSHGPGIAHAASVPGSAAEDLARAAVRAEIGIDCPRSCIHIPA